MSDEKTVSLIAATLAREAGDSTHPPAEVHMARARELLAGGGQAPLQPAAPELEPVEAALLDWFPAATITHADQTQTVNLLGGNGMIAGHYARAIAEWLAANGPNQDGLADFLRDPSRGGGYVRAYAIASAVAAGILVMLQAKELL